MVVSAAFCVINLFSSGHYILQFILALTSNEIFHMQRGMFEPMLCWTCREGSFLLAASYCSNLISDGKECDIVSAPVSCISRLTMCILSTWCGTKRLQAAWSGRSEGKQSLLADSRNVCPFSCMPRKLQPTTWIDFLYHMTYIWETCYLLWCLVCTFNLMTSWNAHY